MLPKEVDILVVGLGPAGSAAARFCAEAGLKVLGIEKRAEIGAPKRCAEGISLAAIKRSGLKLDKKCVSHIVHGATLYAPNGKFTRIDYKKPSGWIVERKLFDKHIAKEAATAGAKLLAKTEAISVKRENGLLSVKVKTSDGTEQIKTKILIACDGIESKISRELGIDTILKLTDIATCAQFEMAGIKIDPKRIEFYFGKQVAPSGYLWIFPKGKDSANVGVGIRKPWAKKTAYEYLKDFVNSNKNLRNGSIIEVNAGGVPVGGILKNMVADNLILAGDAAHQVNPVHGGGIGEAYFGGKLAAQVAVKAIKSGNLTSKTLSEYNKIWHNKRGKKLEKLIKLRQFMEELPDEEFNWLVDYISGEDLVSLAEAGGLKRFGILLMRKPKLLKLAKRLF